MFEKEKTYFPKTKDPQCPLKWNWSTIWLTDGTTSSCHRNKQLAIDPANFDDFHNLPHKIKEREIMLSGKWPTIENGGSGHCNYCKKIEDMGGTSDRLAMLTIPNQSPPELLSNPKATSVTPRILEVFLNDTCNMKCTYCGLRDSSQWKSEIKKYGAMTDTDGNDLAYLSPSNPKMNKNPKQTFYFEKTKEWIMRHGHKLARLHLLGGETFYQSELDEVLDVLDKKNEKSNLELNIVSNLMVKEERFKSVFEKIERLCRDRKIGRFDLTASIDGWGPEVEYARTGLKCDHFEKLFAYAVNQKWARLHVNLTVSSMSVRSTPTLLRLIKSYRNINEKILLRLSSVTNTPHLHPEVFGRDFWDSDVKNIISEWPQDSEQDKIQGIQMASIFESIQNQDPNQKMLKQFKHFLDQLDQRRHTNWRTVFPYLDI